MLHKLKLGLASTALTMGLTLFTVPSAFATEAPSEYFAEARAFLTSYDVPAPVQDDLFDKLENGEGWDSFSSSSEPVTVSDSQSDGFDIRVARYADGSVSVSRVEIPVEDAGGISTFSSPHSCTISGSWRNNCMVDMWVGVVSMNFTASYNVSTNQVANVYGAGWTVGGACSTNLVYLGAPSWNIGRMDLNAQMCGVGYNTTFYLQVTVSGGVATESWG